jgi:hypothetical protein
MCGKRLGEKLKEGKYEFGNRLTVHKAQDALEWGHSKDLPQDLIVCLLVLEDARTLNRMLSLRMDRGRSHLPFVPHQKRCLLQGPRTFLNGAPMAESCNEDGLPEGHPQRH